MSSEVVSTPYGLLPENLKCESLVNLCVKSGIQTGPFGSQLHKKDYVIDGTPIITVEHLGENRITHENLPRVSDKDKQRLSKYHVQVGDIVFSRVGSVDRRALVQPKEDGWLFSGRCLRVRPKPELIDSRWLSYFFGMSTFKTYIRGIAVGATMPSLNTKILSDVPIYFPSLDCQREAADFLVLLDDRITLLRETNVTLEAVAQALFKSWFVDFDPVRAKAEGRAPEGIDVETARLFPDSFEETELGLVPQGWCITTLDNAYEINPTRRLKKGEWSPYLDMASVPTRGHHPEIIIYREMGSGSKFINGDTLLARITPCLQNGKTAYVDFLSDDNQVGWGSTEFVVLRPRLPLPLYHGYLLSRHNPFRDFAIKSMSGTSGRQRIQNDVLGRYPVTIPSQNIAEAFGAIVTPIQKKITANSNQAKILADLRDALLPRLISGQLQIPMDATSSELVK
jgi:type I restriction enzyme S subunit